MVALNGHILSLFHVVDALEDGQAMTYTSNAHALEVIMLKRNKGLANNLVFYTQSVSCCCVLFNVYKASSRISGIGHASWGTHL